MVVKVKHLIIVVHNVHHMTDDQDHDSPSVHNVRVVALILRLYDRTDRDDLFEAKNYQQLHPIKQHLNML